eukprot:CAMPEP_0181210810 /NCGR_PEP_ID=MMETSP1096-20121128/23440_1 /TAXON_ID=156174 ORGANISM="Chrysochromulina ericina, Strain CCMP281" /NCGR_SAMPLE_ID=MMETSP1096 /ASSEMBLY_ACC=CAM_ASM_000453 /LENGTH=151 /DNA_ID=CAMNT_0023302147 /DNA_START=487 /DNA_END=942 /DNA_ORIENTATION=-
MPSRQSTHTHLALSQQGRDQEEEVGVRESREADKRASWERSLEEFPHLCGQAAWRREGRRLCWLGEGAEQGREQSSADDGNADDGHHVVRPRWTVWMRVPECIGATWSIGENLALRDEARRAHPLARKAVPKVSPILLLVGQYRCGMTRCP